MNGGVVASVVACVVLACGCVHTLPPPATPERIVPEVHGLRPLAEGEGHVLLDVPDGPSEVYHWVSTEERIKIANGGATTATRVGTELLCVTPCAVAGPPGRYDVGFAIRGSSRLDIVPVEIRAETTVYRRALGRRHASGAGLVLGIVAVAFGAASALPGAVLLPVGLAQSDADGFVISGAITLGVGALLLALGIWAIADDFGVEQPGAGIQFTPPHVEASLGVDVAATPPQ